MLIYPALDIIENQCVRLNQGDFKTKKIYDSNPLNMAVYFEKQGADWIHIVDLTGAKNKTYNLYEILQSITKSCPKLKIQTGGGITSLEIAKRVFESGANRIVLGNLAIKNPNLFCQILNYFGTDNVTLALDVQICDGIPYVMSNAWEQKTALTLFQLLDNYTDMKIQHILSTDITKDGMLCGPNLDLYKIMASRYPNLNIQASGGVTTIDDIKKLKDVPVSGVVIGKSIYEKNLALSEALLC